MKKTFILLMSMLALTGSLAYAAYRNNMLDDRTSNQTTQYVVEEQTVQMKAEETGQTVEVERTAEAEKQAELEEAKAMEDENSSFIPQQDNYYSYKQLTEPEKTLYVEILRAVSEYQEDVTVSSIDKDEINKIFQCVLNDHPEIFYVDGYTYTQYTLGDVLKKITFSATYCMDKAEKEERQTQIDNYVNQFLEQMPKEADDYTKVKYIYEYIIENTEYDANTADNQNICSVFLNHKSVCQGYAKATQYLLQQVDIPAALILGAVDGGEGHAWNLVQIDKEWYYVDTTWGDASYQAVGVKQDYPKQKIPTINYDYLCVTTEQLCKTHQIDNVVEPPICNAMDANYYVREGLYVTAVDEAQLERIFQDGYEKGSTFVTLKCASLDIYRQLQEMLITNQAIFHYLNCPEGVVSYTDNEKQYSMSFWL